MPSPWPPSFHSRSFPLGLGEGGLHGIDGIRQHGHVLEFPVCEQASERALVLLGGDGERPEEHRQVPVLELFVERELVERDRAVIDAAARLQRLAVRVEVGQLLAHAVADHPQGEL
mgnify:CR=1 FL=1